MKTKAKKSLVSTLVTLIVWAFIGTAFADLRVYEPFDYPAGPLDGQSGSTEIGFDGSWFADSTTLVAAGTLDYGLLPTTGNKIAGYPTWTNSFGGSRTISSSALAANGLLDDGATLWFSAIIGFEPPASNNHFSVAFGSDSLVNAQYSWLIQNGGEAIGIHLDWLGPKAASFSGSDSSSENPDQLASTTGVAYGAGDHGLVVVKCEWGATPQDDDTITLYQPDAILQTPGDPISVLQVKVDQTVFDTFSFRRGDTPVMDEVRFGDTFLNVVGDGAGDPVPLIASLITALNELRDHINGTDTLSLAEIATHMATIESTGSAIGYDATTITAAMEVVTAYDTVVGPLFVQGSPVQNFNRSAVADDDINWVVFNVMQHLHDSAYTGTNIASHETLLEGFKFGTADYFPGYCAPPANPLATHTATIDASFPESFGRDTVGWRDPARKPTGTYAAPGTVVTVTVPSSMVNKGYILRVGGNAYSYSHRTTTKRLDRCSRALDIDSTQMKVISPLGGGIYIEVPYRADAGVVNIDITGAVRSPYFSAKSFHTTTLSEWQNTERNHPAPWADFQSGKFMMQVPTDWIYNLNDPVTLIEDWDKAQDATNDLMGFPLTRGKETMYLQVDVDIKAGVYAPGYPAVNNTYNPDQNYGGLANHFYITGPQNAPYFEFHEQGHGYLFPKFGGETESTVNLLHTAVWNQKFGYSMDEALEKSMNYNIPWRTLDRNGLCWMMCENFKNNQPMERLEKQYQTKGHAKFADIAQMFGWDKLGNFWYSYNYDDENEIPYSLYTDHMILRLCQAVGYDVRPLLHFWGIHPGDASWLDAAVAAENFPETPLIYDRLLLYKSMIPADNAGYQSFAYSWWGNKQPSAGGYMTEAYHASTWDTYDSAYAAVIHANVQNIIDLYYPTGRPGDGDTVSPDPDPMTWAIAPAPASEGAVVYEGFDYSSGANLTGTGGTGFGGSWATSANTETGGLHGINSAGLTFTDGSSNALPVVGNSAHRGSASGRSQANRVLSASSRSTLLADGSTMWFSVLHKRNLEAERTGFVIGTSTFDVAAGWELSNYASGGEGFGFGSSLEYPIGAIAYDNVAGLTKVDSTVEATTTKLIVGKIVWNASGSNDVMYLYNVTDLNTEPTSPIATVSADTDQSAFDRISLLGNQNGAIYDEFRLGTSFASVAGGSSGVGETQITMTATTATDASGVEYYFTCTSGGGHDSGWQDSPTYTDTGLTPGVQYTYTVTVRDKSSNQNTGTASDPASAITDGGSGGGDFDPPTPNPASFASAPNATGDTSISMTASTGSDASGPVEYLFTETSGNPGGSSSGWQFSPSYTDTGLSASTQYTYTVTMRDSLGNTGSPSVSASATTSGGGGGTGGPVAVTGITGHDGGNWPVSLGHLSDMVNALNPSLISTSDTDPGMDTSADPADPSTWTYSGSSWAQEWKANSRLNAGASSNSKIGWTVLDLGSVTSSLENMYLWNVRSQHDTENVATYNVYYANSPSASLPAMPDAQSTTGDFDFSSGGWTLLNSGGALSLPVNASNNNTPQGVVALGGISARYIGIEILTAGNGTGSGRVGLAQVEITASGGSPSVTVPNVVGLSQSSAQSAITAANLTVGNVTTASSGSVAAGDVISQNPMGGSSVSSGTAVDLVVSTGVGNVTVPDVVGLSQSAAESAITTASLTVGNITTQYSSTVAADDVISQGLAAGASVPAGSAVDLVVSLGVDPSPKLVRITVSSVSSTNWTTVNLGKTYNSAVIIATPIYPDNTTPSVATRIKNVTSTGFDLKIDRADGQTGEITIDVSVIAVDEGVYTVASDGVKMEAVKVTSTLTSRKGNWVGESRSYQNSYTTPVVVGQVMSVNDTGWSAFWSMGATRFDPADSSNLSVGKHVAEDTNTTRADETIGYIVIESGSGNIEGIAYEAGVGADTVLGAGNSATPYSYSLSGGLSSASAAAVSISGMDGNNGAWGVLAGNPAFTTTSIGLYALECQMVDSERNHTDTQMSYIVFE